MGRQRLPRGGCVIRIPVGGGSWTFARVLSERPLVAIYDARTEDSHLNLDWVVTRPVLFVLGVANAALRDDRWEVVGHRKICAGEIHIPLFFRQDVLFRDQCRLVDHLGNEKAASVEDCVGLERDAVWEGSHVEDRLADHYAGRANRWVESLRLVAPS